LNAQIFFNLYCRPCSARRQQIQHSSDGSYHATRYNRVMTVVIRAFIAIELPARVKQYLAALTDELAARTPSRSVRWVKAERMHLTLRFLGETDKNLLPRLGAALDTAGTEHAPFALQLDGFGCFPNCRRPRVLWAGLAGDLEAAASLKAGIDAALEPVGWAPEERPFKPHLTLGRVKDARQLGQPAQPETIDPLPIPVTAFHLLQSDLKPQGPIYTIRHTSRLAPR
jgi:2'-5' RNA ligase